VNRVQKFNKDCESFRNFDDGIRRDTTRRSYHYYLDELLRFAQITNYEDLAKLDQEQIHDLLKNWIRDMKEKGLKYKSAKTKLNAAELFFEMNRKILYKKILHKALPDSDYLPFGDVPFSTEELWKIKQAAKKPRDIAVVDFLASTGIRPASLIDPVLRIKHLKEMPHSCKAVRIYEGSKEGYWAFLTPEASSSLENYLNWRKSKGELITPESILFQNYENPNKKKEYLSHESIRQMLNGLFVLAGISRIKTKNRYDKAIVYGFRKRFNGILKMNNEINSNIAEKLMAHKRGLDGSYLKPTLEECFKEFKKAIQDLTLDPSERQKFRIKELESGKPDFEEILKEKEILEGKIASLESQNVKNSKIFSIIFKELALGNLSFLDKDEDNESVLSCIHLKNL
jgi:integrase/recombinase XerD